MCEAEKPVFRLYHQALDDSLSAARVRSASRAEDQHAISGALIQLVSCA